MKVVSRKLISTNTGGVQVEKADWVKLFEIAKVALDTPSFRGILKAQSKRSDQELDDLKSKLSGLPMP